MQRKLDGKDKTTLKMEISVIIQGNKGVLLMVNIIYYKMRLMKFQQLFTANQIMRIRKHLAKDFKFNGVKRLGESPEKCRNFSSPIKKKEKRKKVLIEKTCRIKVIIMQIYG